MVYLLQRYSCVGSSVVIQIVPESDSKPKFGQSEYSDHEEITAWQFRKDERQ